MVVKSSMYGWVGGLWIGLSVRFFPGKQHHRHRIMSRYGMEQQDTNYRSFIYPLGGC